MMVSCQLINQLKRHESKGPVRNGRFMIYHCDLGFLRVGWNHNLETKPLSPSDCDTTNWDGFSVSEEGANWLLMKDIKDCRDELQERIPRLNSIGRVRRDVLIDLAVGFGVDCIFRILSDVNNISAGYFVCVAKEILCSDLYRVDGKRIRELAEQMRTGKYAS